jgi:hypothetical protein
MRSLTYADLELRILKQEAKGHPVEVNVYSAAGPQEYRGGFLVPEDAPALALAGVADGEYGLSLFNWLFADPLLRQHWATVAGEHKLQRIRLRIDEEAAGLHLYPWEALSVERPGAVPLPVAAADATPFSRYLAGGQQPGSPIYTRPVRVLVAIANPDDLKDYNPPLAPIDEQAELASLAEALKPLKGVSIELTQLHGPCTLKRLADELRKGYHILHLICHGLAAPGVAPGTPDTSALILADDNNKARRVSDQEFATQLALQLGDPAIDAEQKLRLVFLASCETAQRSAYDAFRGVAPQLIAAGVPAVLAMQDNIGMDAARVFAAAFYKQLLNHGQVDLAANQARKSLLADDAGDNQMQVAIPVLFQRLRDGQLFGVRGVVAAKQEDRFWPYLLGNIEGGSCTVFLGPRLNAGGIADSTAIAQQLAKFYRYPMADAENRVRVAQFVALGGQMSLRRDYLKFAKQSVLRGLEVREANENILIRDNSIGQLLDKYGWSKRIRELQESEPHLQLADLPIGLYMTTDLDSLMYAALQARYLECKAKLAGDLDERQRAYFEALQAPRREQPRWNLAGAASPEYALMPPPDQQHPVVFHLNGYDEDPEHLVLTEDEHLRQLIYLMDEKVPQLPSSLRGKLAQDSLVFIGFSLDDWEFRMILHGLLKRLTLKHNTRHVGVQLDADTASGVTQARSYLQEYLGSHLIDIYWGTPRQFVGELHSRWNHYLETGNDAW